MRNSNPQIATQTSTGKKPGSSLQNDWMVVIIVLGDTFLDVTFSIKKHGISVVRERSIHTITSPDPLSQLRMIFGLSMGQDELLAQLEKT